MSASAHFCILRFLILMCVPVFSSTVPACTQTFDPLPVREIAPGVYAFEGAIALMDHANEGGIANIGFIVGDDAVAVVDTGGSVLEGQRLLAAIHKITEKPIRYVINTHEHPDHVFGNAAFIAPSITFVGHKDLPRSLAQRGQFYISAFRPVIGDDLIKNVRIIPPTLLVDIDKEMRLDLGHRIIVLHAWPIMHTDCDLTAFDEKTATLFTGDLVFLKHVPVVDGSLKGWLAAMDRLSAIPAKLAVPGHGEIGLDWPKALADERIYLDKLAKDLRALISKGDDVGEAAKIAGQSESGKWQLFNDYNARNATAGFAELEWE
jgi:quinoprotein relay system zinc metallohydrolase 2